MSALTWWKVISLTLFFFLQLTLYLSFYYLYGVCRLAEERFGKKTLAPLLVCCSLLMLACTLGLAVSPAFPFSRPWFAICSSAAALLLTLVSVRCYQAMMGR